MSRDNFDNEVSELYQQRKAQIIAPKIELKEQIKAHRLSPLRLSAIFVAGGVASFGIMAVISHLSNSQLKTAPLYEMNHHVEIADITSVKEAEKAIRIKQPLPPKPIVKQPKNDYPVDADKQITDKLIEPETLTFAQVQLVTLPQLKEPKLVIQPIYKVLPKYSPNSLHGKQSGEIQLKYQITPAGAVESITIIKSSVGRELQKSAKKALAKWQYKPSNNFNNNYEIIFEFKADKN